MLDHALAYAARGWPVFPCDPRTKAPLVQGDRDADGAVIPNTGGFHKATTEVETIRAWWRRWPKALIAVPMGAASGVWVLDLDLGDPPLIGLDAYRGKLTALVGALPATATARTRSGGEHQYYRFDPASVGSPGTELEFAL